jgi:hypothetical protein
MDLFRAKVADFLSRQPPEGASLNDIVEYVGGKKELAGRLVRQEAALPGGWLQENPTKQSSQTSTGQKRSVTFFQLTGQSRMPLPPSPGPCPRVVSRHLCFFFLCCHFLGL